MSGWRQNLVLSAAIASVCGCATSFAPPDRPNADAIVYYLDGAGGGNRLIGWAKGVRNGLYQAGYRGGFEELSWQTGFGAGFDEAASMAYKRRQAARLAARIRTFRQTHPDGTVHLFGFSAGTSIAVLSLEALPPQCQVDDVVLVASSLGATYDLTEALERVRHRMYVFTSPKDMVLRLLVPVLGTADRAPRRTRPAGLDGFHPPPDAGDKTTEQYAKVQTIEWSSALKADGHNGGHTGAVSARFVRLRVAPLLRAGAPEVFGNPSAHAGSANVASGE